MNEDEFDDCGEDEDLEDEDDNYDDSMDGDFDSAMESAGMGYDEQYTHWESDE